MDVDQPWLKHGVISERGTVCRELNIFLAMPYPYQITMKIIQRVSNIGFYMLECGFSPKNALFNCLNMACQIATRMTMLKKGQVCSGATWWFLICLPTVPLCFGETVSLFTRSVLLNHGNVCSPNPYFVRTQNKIALNLYVIQELPFNFPQK